MLDLTSLLAMVQQMRNPEIVAELPRIQGLETGTRVSYYGSKWAFSFFSYNGTLLAVPDRRALERLRACPDGAGTRALWQGIAGL